MTTPNPYITAIILTHNEEANLAACLESLKGLDCQVFVVDSHSTDRTVEIAQSLGAEVVARAFVNQAEQFNWALDNLPIRGQWTLRLDADEYLLPELREEIARVLPTLPPEVTGLYLRRRLIFLGRWMRHGGHYPTWILRLFRTGKARSELIDINEHVVLLEGESKNLENDFVDENHKGLAFWTMKHEKHAGRKVEFLAKLADGYDEGWIKPRLLGSQAERKRWLMSRVYSRSPMFARSFAYFTYRYFVRMGFLDGVPGLIYHFLHGGWYSFYTDAKAYERIVIKNGDARRGGR